MSRQKNMIDPDGRFAPLIEPVINDMGCRLVRVALLPAAKGRKQTLQILIEPLDGSYMGIDDCADISRALSALMDVEDPVRGKYTLEVSSPGMARPLTRFEDFSHYLNHSLKIELRQVNQDGRKRFRGQLLAANDAEQTITIQTEDAPEPSTLAFDDLAMAKILVDEDMIRAALNKSNEQPEQNAQKRKG